MTLLFLSLILSACGPTQVEVDATALQIALDHFSTQTAEAPTVTSTNTPSPTVTPSPTATATPTPSPTLAHTPTSTLTPTPRWMGAALTLKDLPDGFEQSDPEEMSMLQQDLPRHAVVFSFEHEVKAQAILGYLIPLSTSLDRLAFDRTMPVSLEVLAEELGSTSSPEAIPGIEDVGEARSAAMFVTKVGSISLHLDGLLFRRGDVGVILFVSYLDGEELDVQIAALARLLDKRLGAPLKPSATWRDEFDTAPVEPWEWVNENPESWSLSDGNLRIYASSFPTGQENLLLRPVTSPDFIIQTAVLFMPEANFQFAGLVIYQDAYNFLQLGRAFCDTPGDCVGSGIYFDKVLVSRKSGENFGIRALSQGKVFLRLELHGAQVKAFYSFEGNTWFTVGTHELPSGFQVNGVGLTTSQDYYTPDVELPADFDYFELVEGG